MTGTDLPVEERKAMALGFLSMAKLLKPGVYYMAGFKQGREYSKQREEELRKAIRLCLDERDTEWAVDPADMDQHDRCLCGHFRGEHDGHCHGAYGTLTPDADDKSVEVCCPCDNFYKVEANYHPVRR